MTRHVIPRVRAHSLAAHLAGLGLIRVLAEQADRELRCFIDGTSLVVDTSVDDLAMWLVDAYVPMPVLSPWNEGSGFGAKDKISKVALDNLRSNRDPRLDPLREAFSAVNLLAQQARAERWDKHRLVTTIRNKCPEPMLPWVDAAVIALEDDLAFPPLLGSGGNDGRLDFSTNFHQRLLELLPVDDKTRRRSVDLAHDWLKATNREPLTRGAIGQFDPGASGTPNTSPFGAADSLVNPWLFVLMVEGSVWFAAAPARRLDHQVQQRSRAAMTFMTDGSDDGTTTGTAAEQSRGEVWVPWWSRPLTVATIRQVFAEGRAVWRGRTATRPDQMYLATAAGGISPYVAGLDRYAILRRNGLAFAATLVDEVQVHANDAVDVISAVEDWPDRLSRRNTSSAVTGAVRRFAKTRVDLVREHNARRQVDRIRDLLVAVTDTELTAGRSGHLRQDLRPVTRPRSGRHLTDFLYGEAWSHVEAYDEFRVALGLASIVTPAMTDAPNGRTMRELLLPINPPPNQASLSSWRDSPIVAGLGQRPLIDVLADVLTWLVTSAPRRNDPNAPAAKANKGVTGSRRSVAVPWMSLHAWVTDGLCDQDIELWLRALLALDWRDVDFAPPTGPAPVTGRLDPTLAVLAAFRNGIRSHDEHDSASRYGLHPSWIAQLTGGHPERAHRLAAARLRQLGFGVAEPPTAMSVRATERGKRITAALLPYASHHKAFAATTRALTTTNDDGTPSRPHIEESA